MPSKVQLTNNAKARKTPKAQVGYECALAQMATEWDPFLFGRLPMAI